MLIDCIQIQIPCSLLRHHFYSSSDMQYLHSTNVFQNPYHWKTAQWLWDIVWFDNSCVNLEMMFLTALSFLGNIMNNILLLKISSKCKSFILTWRYHVRHEKVEPYNSTSSMVLSTRSRIMYDIHTLAKLLSDTSHFYLSVNADWRYTIHWLLAQSESCIYWSDKHCVMVCVHKLL